MREWYPVSEGTQCAGESPAPGLVEAHETEQESVTCVNVNGDRFPCGAQSTCCGNAGAAPGSKCCRPHGRPRREWYPVSVGTQCAGSIEREAVFCVNSVGDRFPCGAGSTCCGNACAAPGSKCCRPHGRPRREWYPVSADTQCAGSDDQEQEQDVVTPSYPDRVDETEHAAVTCLNGNGDRLPCGAQSTCCGNACAAPGSKCCRPEGRPRREWYPVSEGTECAGSIEHEAVYCVNTIGDRFPCGPRSTCCGNASAADPTEGPCVSGTPSAKTLSVPSEGIICTHPGEATQVSPSRSPLDRSLTSDRKHL